MSEVLLFNNDDASPSVHTVEAITKFGLTVLPYSLCITDLTPLYLHLFDPSNLYQPNGMPMTL